jgi:hypothetical protein
MGRLEASMHAGRTPPSNASWRTVTFAYSTRAHDGRDRHDGCLELTLARARRRCLLLRPMTSPLQHFAIGPSNRSAEIPVKSEALARGSLLHFEAWRSRSSTTWSRPHGCGVRQLLEQSRSGPNHPRWR